MQAQAYSCKNAAVAAPKAGEASEGAGVVLREVIKKGIFNGQADRKGGGDCKIGCKNCVIFFFYIPIHNRLTVNFHPSGH